MQTPGGTFFLDDLQSCVKVLWGATVVQVPGIAKETGNFPLDSLDDRLKSESKAQGPRGSISLFPLDGLARTHLGKRKSLRQLSELDGL